MSIRSEKGETIIEVLMSIAVLSLAIVGSIVVARSSLLLGQSANERLQALKIAETQIERLKALAPSSRAGDPNGIFRSTDFCVRPDLSIVNIPATPADCANTYFPESALAVVVNYDANGPDGAVGGFDNNVFTVSVTWDSVDGEGRDSVVIEYRLHPLGV